jgi:hypothetical protein
MYTAEDLARAQAHIDTATRLIGEQRERIAKLASDGRDTQGAEALLQTMLQLRDEMSRYREVIGAEVK